MKLSQPISTFRNRYEKGRKLRAAVPRESQARWVAPKDRADPLKTLATVNAGRVAALLPIKEQRMAVSPFAFFRGSAVVMAADLASLPQTGLNVQLCGDAHIRNLGAYAAPDGRLVFDLNDFDETIPGPWEWDVKRLAVSLVLAGGEAGETESRCEGAVRAFAASYRRFLRVFAEMPVAGLARFLVSRRSASPVITRILTKAERVTPRRTLKKLTIEKGGAFRFHDERPLIEHVPRATASAILHALAGYRETLIASRRMVFDAYRAADVAFKLVGTGSVGTRDYVVLMFGNGVGDPLFLQVKQELPSCYEPYLRPRPRDRHQGQRVAEGQQRMQTVSDPFLGFTRFGGADYLVRQLADHKASLEPADLKGRALMEYAALCGEVLAKGHARTGDAAALAGYCGASAKLDAALAEFAAHYAAQVKADAKLFLKSRARGGMQV